MVSLNINQTSQALAITGGYVVVIGLISMFIKETLFLAETLIATLTGVLFGPTLLNLFSPARWAEEPEYLTLQVTRIIIAIQVLFTGMDLPKKYIKTNWKSLATLLGLVMTIAWFICSALVFALIPHLSFLEALVIGSCVTPTDPVLANAICKGKFAEQYVPKHVRDIILAEAGANDGLGFPFLFIPMYLILIQTPDHPRSTIGGAAAEWVYNIVLYQIALSIVLGVIIGFSARKTLRFCQSRHLIDHESFLGFGVALTFFTLGTVGLLGSDDIFACFVAGCTFGWEDWINRETHGQKFQEVTDLLINSAVFIYIGAIIPWYEFNNYHEITIWRLVALGACIMLFRRLPWVMALMKLTPALPTWQEAAFAGFFGPIGVGALFYTQVALEHLPHDGTREHLRTVLPPVVMFLILTSIIVHGITIALAMGFQRMSGIILFKPIPEHDAAEPIPLGSETIRRVSTRIRESVYGGMASRYNVNAMLDNDPDGAISKASLTSEVAPMGTSSAGMSSAREPPRTPMPRTPRTPVPMPVPASTSTRSLARNRDEEKDVGTWYAGHSLNYENQGQGGQGEAGGGGGGGVGIGARDPRNVRQLYRPSNQTQL